MARKFLGVAPTLLSNWVTRGDIAPVRNPQSSAYSVQASDLGKLIECTGTWTLGTLAAATAGAGFYFYVKKTDNTGVITIDPNSSETIAGLTSIALYGGECGYKIWTDGTAWYTLGRQKGLIVLSSVALTGQTLSTLSISDGFADTELSQLKVVWDSLALSTTASVTLKVIKGGAAAVTYSYSLSASASTTPTVQSSPASSSVPASQSTFATSVTLSGSVEFQNAGLAAFATQPAKLQSATFASGGSTPTTLNGWFVQPTATAVQGVQFGTSTGTISGIDYSVMGLRA